MPVWFRVLKEPRPGALPGADEARAVVPWFRPGRGQGASGVHPAEGNVVSDLCQQFEPALSVGPLGAGVWNFDQTPPEFRDLGATGNAGHRHTQRLLMGGD